MPSPRDDRCADSGPPALAVIIPAYNAYAALSNTLASLALQVADGPRIETIVIDNNSTTRPLDALHHRFRAPLSMTLVKQPALPHPFALGRARNTGMRLTKAKWILLLDADCIPGPRFMHTVGDLIGAHDRVPLIATGERVFIDALESDVLTTYDRLEALTTRPRVPSSSNYGLLDDRRLPAMRNLSASSHPWAYMHAGLLLYRATEARGVDGFDERYDGHWGYEDADFAYRMIAQAGCQPEYVEELKVFHQESTDTIENGTVAAKHNKRTNPNWQRVCATIPGYEQYKRRQWATLGVEVLL